MNHTMNHTQQIVAQRRMLADEVEAERGRTHLDLAATAKAVGIGYVLGRLVRAIVHGHG